MGCLVKGGLSCRHTVRLERRWTNGYRSADPRGRPRLLRQVGEGMAFGDARKKELGNSIARQTQLRYKATILLQKSRYLVPPSASFG